MSEPGIWILCPVAEPDPARAEELEIDVPVHGEEGQVARTEKRAVLAYPDTDVRRPVLFDLLADEWGSLRMFSMCHPTEGWALVRVVTAQNTREASIRGRRDHQALCARLAQIEKENEDVVRLGSRDFPLTLAGMTATRRFKIRRWLGRNGVPLWPDERVSMRQVVMALGRRCKRNWTPERWL